MTWLLNLYPPRWRRRYGGEFRALIAPLPFSFGLAIDIIGGAIDAWTQPQSHLSPRRTSHPEGDTIMLTKTMRLQCAGKGAKATTVDGVKGAAVILGGSLVTAAFSLWMGWRQVQHPYAMALMNNAWLFFFIVSMPYWLLTGWPARAKAVFIGALTSAVGAIVLASAWLGR